MTKKKYFFAAAGRGRRFILIHALSGGAEEAGDEGFGSQKKYFENIKDNWRDTAINAKVQQERQQEMDQLKNRYWREKYITVDILILRIAFITC